MSGLARTDTARSPRDRIDPELAQALALVPKTSAGIFDLSDIEGTRAAIHAMADAAPASAHDGDVAVEVHEVRRPDGSVLGVRVLRPVALSGPIPALVWFHGGGQVLGYAGQEDSYLEPIVAQVGCLVVSVDYRLAPEAPSPAAAEDAHLGYSWLRSEAAGLGIDPDRIGIAGASGGGCIAAALALMIRDRGTPPPLFQALNYPMLDDRNETASSHEITDIGVWDRPTNILAWKAILGDRVGRADVSPYSVPARADDLTGLPPTFIAIGELDLFRDEGLAYATNLMSAGVPVELHVYPGAYHAWDLFAPGSGLAATFTQAWFSYLARHLRTLSSTG